MTANIAAFRHLCKDEEAPEGTAIVRFECLTLTAYRLWRIICIIRDTIGWQPEWDDCGVVTVDRVRPKDAVALAEAILDEWSPAERYTTGMSVEFQETSGAVWILVPEVTASEGRGQRCG